METFKLVGILSAMILMVVAGVGFEFAHAVGNHDEAMVLSIQEMDALEHGSSLNSDAYNRQEFPLEEQESSPSGKIAGRGHTTE
jgi:hypothetical protein